MAKWFLAIIIFVAFPIAAYAQESSMEAWLQQKLGVQVPNLEISQSWKSMPIMGNCEYEWYVQWKDAKFQIKDQNENYYRVYYQDNMLTVDFKRAFNGIFGG